MDLWIELRKRFKQQGGKSEDLQALLAQKDGQGAIGGFIAHCRQNPLNDLSRATINIGWKRIDIDPGSELEVLTFQAETEQQITVGRIGFISIASIVTTGSSMSLTEIISWGSTRNYDWCSAGVALGFHERPYLFPYSEACKAIFAGTALQNKKRQKFAAAYKKPCNLLDTNIEGEWVDQVFKPGIDNGISERTYLAYWRK